VLKKAENILFCSTHCSAVREVIMKDVSEAIAVLDNQCYYTENVQLVAHMKTVIDCR
jgi:hypothetical protein